MRFTLRQLQVYLATARCENLTLAAQTLALSQSAASEALKSLEDHYGVRLFDRLGKRLRLNDFGRELRPLVERLLEQAQQLEQRLDHRSPSNGSLTVGATLSIGNYLGIRMLAAFRASHPQTRTRLEVGNTSAIAEKILAYDIDLGLVEGEINHPDLRLHPWIDDELVIFCAPGYLPAEKILYDHDLCAMPWILREEGSGTRQSFDAAMRGLLPSLHIALVLQHTEAIKRAVEAGLGVGCLSRITLEDAFRRGTLVPLRAPLRDFRRKLYTIIHREKYLTPGILAWLDLCEQFRGSQTAAHSPGLP